MFNFLEDYSPYNFRALEVIISFVLLIIANGSASWWLVRVTLVVDWLFLPWNFSVVVGTYEGLLLFCECTWGGESIFRWQGHLNTICLLCPQVVGILKPSANTLCPLHPPLCTLHPLFAPFAPFTPLCPDLYPSPPSPPSPPSSLRRATWWNFHCLIFKLVLLFYTMQSVLFLMLPLSTSGRFPHIDPSNYSRQSCRQFVFILFSDQ